jgi:hypothetical protein
VLRIGGRREPFVWPERGVVVDILNMKTGWCATGAGRDPQWKWNRDPGHFEAQPGEGYKKGFSIPCAIGGGPIAGWEQAGVAIWKAIAGLSPEQGKLPLVQQQGTLAEKYRKGSTAIPFFRVMLWVNRPACLGGDETFDTVIARAEAEERARREERRAAAAIAAARRAAGIIDEF